MAVEHTCMNCERIETYPGSDNKDMEYLCGTCVQRFLLFSDEELLRGYDLCLEKGWSNKATIIRMFVNTNKLGENLNDRIKRNERHIAKHLDRGRNTRANKVDKITARKFKKHQDVSIS